MARDEGLMERARSTGECVFAVYGWETPTLSFGRNQMARGSYDLAAIQQHRIDLVRRPTGGRALLHDREVTYSVTAPVDPGESLVEAYHRFNRVLLAGLERLGVNASESAGEGRTPPPTTMPCFAAPTSGELVTGGSKLVGSAQVREDGALLQHGSILIEDDQHLITRLLTDPGSVAPAPRAATLASSLGRVPEVHEVASALFAAVRELEDENARELEVSEADSFAAEHLERYRSEWWTWRR
jgi:lipoate-protein ligase A